MNIRSKKAIQIIRGVNFLYLYPHKTAEDVNEMIEMLISPFISKDSFVDDDKIKQVRKELFQMLSQESNPNTYETLCKSHSESYVSVDNILLILGQYYPVNKTPQIVCPLTHRRILPEVSRFILSCGAHLSLNGIMATDDDVIAATISLTQRDKLRIKLFRLQQLNNNLQKQAGIASAMVGEVFGLIAVYQTSLHFTVALIPLMPVISFILMPLAMGFIGMAISRYCSSKQKEDILKQMIGDAPPHTSLQTFHQLHNPPASRWNLFSLTDNFSADTNKSVSHAYSQVILPPYSLHFLKP